MSPLGGGSFRAATECFLDSTKNNEDEFENMEALNDALRKIKYKKPGHIKYNTWGNNFVMGSIVFPVARWPV